MKAARLFLTMLIAVLFIIGGCMFDDSGTGIDGPAYVGSLKVYGIVTTENGQPLEDVHITTENGMGQIISTYSDEMGLFFFESARTQDRRFILEADKEGYFHKSYASMSVGKDAKVRLVMNTKNTASITANEPAEVAVSDKARVMFKPNSFVQENGTPYSGEVTVAYTYANPESPLFGLVMQGGDLRGLDANLQTQHLISYGAMGVELSGSNGEQLQLAPGQTATLEMEVPGNMLSEAPAQIPLWYFDEEKNIWVEEGSATLQGNKYVGEVSHFTWWNCDDPVSIKSFVTGTVVDCNGNPVPGVVVSVGPLQVTTNADGSYISNVASGLEFNVLIDPLFNYGLGSSNTIYVASAPEEGVMTLEPLVFDCMAFLSGSLNFCSDYSAYLVTGTNYNWADVVPITDNFTRVIPAGNILNIAIRVQSTAINAQYYYTIPPVAEGNTYTLSTAINLECPITIQGKVFDCNQQPIAANIFARWMGGSNYYYATDVNYTFQAPANLPVYITFSNNQSYSYVDSITISVPALPGETVYTMPDVEFPCPTTISGTVTDCTGNPVALTVSAAGINSNFSFYAAAGNFSVQVAANEPVTLSASKLIDGDVYGGATTITPLPGQVNNASFQLCNVLLDVDCSMLGMQLTTNSNIVNFDNMLAYEFAPTITIPMATANPYTNQPETFNLPPGYTALRLTNGPVYCVFVLPEPVEPGLYSVQYYPNIALNSPIGMMLVNNNTISAITTNGTITIESAGPDNITGSFSGGPGSIVFDPQFPSGTFSYSSSYYGYFCIPY